MRYVTNEDAHKTIGIPGRVLRDWRRRGLLDGIGGIVLPGGKLTTDEAHPALAKVERKNWVYRPGDLVALAIAKNLAEIGLDLRQALQLALRINPKIVAWLRPADSQHLLTDRDPRFIVAWPAGEGTTTGNGVALGNFEIIALSDLSRITDHIGCKAIIIDCAEMAGSLPAGIRKLIAGGAK